jgi:hypothetical protein
VSSNLCLALAKLAQREGVDLSVSWSPADPEPSPAVLRLSREDAGLLHQVAQEMKATEPEPDFQLEGVVTNISSPQQKADGMLLIEALLNGSVKKVRVEFGAKDRDTVFEAGKNKLWIKVVGELRREGKKLVLQNPRELEIVQPDDDDT